MSGMTKDELTQFLASKLQPVEEIFQKHIPKYFSEWDDLFTTVVWLLRANKRNSDTALVEKKFWHNSNKDERLVIPYDLVPYTKDRSYKVVRLKADSSFTAPKSWRGTRPGMTRLSPRSEDMIKNLQDYFKAILKNVETILNVRFERRKLCNPSPGRHKPQLRLVLWDYSSIWGGFARFPGDLGGGDISVALYRDRENNPSLKTFDFLKKVILHELGHALGLSHMHANDEKDCGCEVRNHKVSSPPPVFVPTKGKPVYHKYANPADSMMVYSQFSNIGLDRFNPKCHFGYIDYLALLCVYGPNSDNKNVKHIKKSYEKDQLLRSEINLNNYNKIKQSIPGRVITYRRIRSADGRRSVFRIVEDESSISGITIKLNDRSLPFAIAGEAREGKTLLYTNTPVHVDGLAGNTQISRYRKQDLGLYNIDLTLSSKTRVSALRGSPGSDVVFFNKNIKYVSGRGGADTYCFYKDKWGCHRIKERQKYGTPNFVVFCQPDLDRLRLYRWKDDLFIYDRRRFKKKNVRLVNYFLSEAPNNMYRILAISKERLFGVDNIPCFRNQFVNIASQSKIQKLRSGQHIAFIKSLQCRLYDRRFLRRLAYRIRHKGCDTSRRVDANYRSNPVKVDRKNPYGIVVRLDGVPEHIGGRILWYKRSKNKRNLYIIWRYKKRVCGFRVCDFFKAGATPLHLVDSDNKHLLTFKGMNGYGPVQAIDSHRIKTGWYKVHFPSQH